jgi:hypothetical protein
VLVISEYFMINECMEILARGYCMHVFLVSLYVIEISLDLHKL